MAAPIAKRRKVSFADEDIEMNSSDAEFSSDSELDQSSTAKAQSCKTRNKRAAQSRSSQASQMSAAALSALMTGGCSQSRMVQLQISSLLDGIRTTNKRRADVDTVLRQLKGVIEKIPSREPVSIADAQKAFQTSTSRSKKSRSNKNRDVTTPGVAIPFPDPKPAADSNLKVSFQPPDYVDVVGSYVGNTSIASSSIPAEDTAEAEVSVDMAVCMPMSMFQEKDHLDYRYAYKRASYVAVLASAIQNSDLGKEKGVEVWFQGWHGNMLQPVIVVRVTPKVDSKSNADKSKKRKQETSPTPRPFRITILPVLQTPPPFPLKKLSLEKSSIRANTKATPFYNSTILQDCSIAPAAGLLRQAAQMSPNFTDACILGRIWLRRHGFGSDLARHGFGVSEWALILATLIGASGGKPMISPGCNTLQMFRAMLHFLASRSLTELPYGAPKPDPDASAPNSHSPIFVLPGVGLNVLFKMGTGGYQMLRRTASAGVEKLAGAEKDSGETSTNVFDGLWGEPGFETAACVGKYDFVVRLELNGDDDSTESGPVDGAADTYSRLLSKATHLQSVLSRGLSDRVRRVDFFLPRSTSWKLSEDASDALLASESASSAINRVTFGFSVNPATVDRLVDLGPSVEEKSEADEFRSFWGDKAELRRFKDGSIRESCVWSDHLSAGGERAIEQISRYLVEKYGGVEALHGMEIDGGVDIIGDFTGSPTRAVSASSCFQPILNAFQALHSVVRDLDSAETLPLRVRSFLPADEQLRYASVRTPDDSKPTPADVVLQFEFSSRWPDDLEAIQRTKMAFLLKVGECLAERDGEYKSRLGLESPDQPIQNQAFLDVRTPAGFVFRVRIQHEREEDLLKKIMSSIDTPPPAAAAAAAALASYKTLYLRRPGHTAALASAATRYPPLSETIRLLKLWFSKHGLLPHFAPELIELFALRVFTSSTDRNGDDVPGTGVAAFVRALDWLGSWDWSKVPAFISYGDNDGIASSTSPAGGDDDDSNGDGSSVPAAAELAKKAAETASAALVNFRAWRSTDPHMSRLALHVSTCIDTDGGAWTQGRPAVVVATRMTVLARNATTTISKSRTGSGDTAAAAADEDDDDESEGLDFEDRLRTSFAPNWKGYQFILYLDQKVLHSDPSSDESTTKLKPGQFKNLLPPPEPLKQKSLADGEDGDDAIVDLSPQSIVSAFVADIYAAYGSSIVLFWDPVDGDRIGGIWNPAVTAGRRWKPRIGYSTVPVSSKGSALDSDDDDDDNTSSADVEINKRAIVAEICRLGGDLIKKVKGL